MFFIASKLLDFAVNPLFYVLGLCLLALFHKKQIVKKRATIGCIILILFFGNNYLGMLIFREWEVAPVAINDLGNYDVAIVLGGFTDVAKEPFDRVHTNASVDRLLHVVQLYRLGKVKKIMISGGNANLFKKDGETIEALSAFRLLQDFKVDSTDIILESASRNTRENAINSKRVLDSLGIGTNKVLLSTSAFHMRRASGCFKKVGIMPKCYPTDIKTHQEMPFQFMNFIMPDISSVERWRMLLHEILGYLMYKVQGYC